MSYKIITDFYGYFGEEYALKIFQKITENRKSNERYVAEEIGIENPTDPELDNLWILSDVKPGKEGDDPDIDLYRVIVYDTVPDIVLDDYNHLMKEL